MNPPNDDLEAIQRLADDWRAGWLAGDANALLSLYADAPVLLPQDQPAVIGKNAIRMLYEPVLQDYDFASESTVMDAEVSGDLGYFWSRYTLTSKLRAGGPSMMSTGKSVFIVKRTKGTWKIALLIDNSDSAPKT